MDMEVFCDKFCPMPFRGTDRNGNQEVDCDMEQSDCPFNDVDFDKVHEYENAKTEYWACWNCGEQNHNDFFDCWKCHKPKQKPSFVGGKE